MANELLGPLLQGFGNTPQGVGGAGIPAFFGAFFMFFIFIIILVLLSYLYFSLALVTIAKKTNTPNAWLAWIPVVNMYLMAKIGSVPVGFAVAAILMAAIQVIVQAMIILALTLLLPETVSVVFNGVSSMLGLGVIAIGTFLLWKVAEARQKPGWIALLTLIPIVNIITTPVVWGIIAWKD